MTTLARCSRGDAVHWAVVEDGVAYELPDSPYAGGEPAPTGEGIPLSELRLLPPCEPSKLVCASGNYRQVIKELNKAWPTEPLIFLKPSTAAIGHDDAIRWPGGVDDLTHEPELALVISRTCRNVSVAEARDYILGYTCANDVSAWDVLAREVQFTRCKGYDTFAPLGPFVVTGDFDPDDLGIRSYVNGTVALETRTDDMVFGVSELVSFASHCMTLLPGDVISTGASGVGHLQPGDRVEIEIDHVGRLGNTVVKDD